MSAELIGVLSVGVALAGLLLAGMKSLREDMRNLREDMRRIEGHVDVRAPHLRGGWCRTPATHRNGIVAAKSLFRLSHELVATRTVVNVGEAQNVACKILDEITLKTRRWVIERITEKLVKRKWGILHQR